MKAKGSLPHSQEPATYPYSEPKQPCPYCSDRARVLSLYVDARTYWGAGFETKYRLHL